MIIIRREDKAVDKSRHEWTIEQTSEMHFEFECPSRRDKQAEKRFRLVQIKTSIVGI